MSYYLAIDCATDHLGLALGQKDGDSLEVFSELVWRDQAAKLHPALTDLFEQAGASPKELTGVMCSVGPGSFTSIRIGLAAARAFCQATGAKGVGITSTQAVAWQYQSPVTVLLEASSDQLHIQHFDKNGNPTSDATIAPADDIFAQLKKGDVVAGFGALNRKDKLPDGVVLGKHHHADMATFWHKGLELFQQPTLPSLKAFYVQPLQYKKTAKKG